MRFDRILRLSIVSFLFFSLQAVAGHGTIYKHLAVKGFDADTGDQVPADFREALRRHLLRQLEQTRRFEAVTLLDAGGTVPPDVDIVLTGKIMKFDKGNRMERYMVPGLGATSIRALIEYTDAASSRSLLKTVVGGRVIMGIMGGDSKGATNGLAKGLAKATKKNLP